MAELIVIGIKIFMGIDLDGKEVFSMWNEIFVGMMKMAWLWAPLFGMLFVGMIIEHKGNKKEN